MRPIFLDYHVNSKISAVKSARFHNVFSNEGASTYNKNIYFLQYYKTVIILTEKGKVFKRRLLKIMKSYFRV